MGTSSTPDGVVELNEGLSLIPCTVVSLSFVRADVSVKPVDEWQLKGGLMAMFKKRFGLAVEDRDLVVRREKNYFKKRRDEPIADGTLHLWGSKPEDETAKAGQEGVDFGNHVVENVNGVELSVGGLKLKCIAVIKETNDFEALKRSWEVVLALVVEVGSAQVQAGPTTLTLKGVPSRWFAEPRVSSKPSVLVTHTIFSGFGEIRNLEVLSNEDLENSLKDVGSMAAALQCQIWVQFDNHTNFCKALHAFCGRAMQKPGSNFRAMYVVDWDKENYFNVLNVRRRKFERERLERQLQAEAEKLRKEEFEARQAELARAEVERLRMEQMAIALREEEERQQQLAEQAQQMEEDSRKQMSDSETSSEEEGLIRDERQESSDDEVPENEREMERRISEEDEGFSPPQKVNGRFMSATEGERHRLQVRGKGSHSSEDEEVLHPPRTREKRRYNSEDEEEEEAPSPYVRDKRRYTPKGRRDTVPMKVSAKRRDSFKDDELQHPLYVRNTKRDTSEDEEERDPPEVRDTRRSIFEDSEERRSQLRNEKRRYTSDDEGERLSPNFAEKKNDTNLDGGRNLLAPEESADQEMYNPLERWQPEEETAYYSKFSTGSIRQEGQISGSTKVGRTASKKRSPSPFTTDIEEEGSEDEEYVDRELGGGDDDDSEVERWALDVTHSVASLSASEMLLQAGHTYKGVLFKPDRPENRLRSVIMINS